MKKFVSTLALSLLAVAINSKADGLTPDERTKCWDAYQASMNPNVKRAGELLRSAFDDYDYPETEDLGKYVRSALGLPKWTSNGYSDTAIFCSVEALNSEDAQKKYCSGTPKTIQFIKADVLVTQLPKYLASNAEGVKSCQFLSIAK